MAYQIIDTHTEQGWHQYRSKGIGASEISSIFGYNPYQSALELFHKKIGIAPAFERNLKAIFGNATEQLSSDLYRCWDGTFKGMIHNYNNKKYMCDIYKFPKYQYVINPEICKSLFVSPDRIRVENGSWRKAIEIKQSGFFARKLYVDGINPSYIFQNKVQTIFCELEAGDIFTLIERDDAYVKEFKRDGYLVDSLTEEYVFAETDAFWGRIEKARVVNASIFEAKRTQNLALVRELSIMLDELEPSVGAYDSLAFENYVAPFFFESNVRKPQREIQGNEEMYEVIQNFVLANKEALEADKKKQNFRNKVLEMCKGSIDFKVAFSGKEWVQVIPTKAGIKIKTNIK